MQKLVAQSIFFSILFIPDGIAVFGISYDPMAASCEMTADLMRFTGNELHLQQSDVAIGSKRFISRLNPGCTRARRLIYLYFITFFIFMQIPADMFCISYLSCTRQR